MKLDPEHELDASTVQFLTALSASMRGTKTELREDELLAFAGGWCDAPTAARVMEGVTRSHLHRQRLIELKKELDQLSKTSLPDLLAGAVRKALSHYSKAGSLLGKRPWSEIKGEVDEESKAFHSVLRSLTSTFDLFNANKVAFSRSTSSSGLGRATAEISETGDLVLRAKIVGADSGNTPVYLYLQAPGGNSVLLGEFEASEGVLDLQLDKFGSLLRMKPGALSPELFRITESVEPVEAVSALPLFDSGSSSFITMLQLSEPPRLTRSGLTMKALITNEVLKWQGRNLTAVLMLGERSVPLASWPIAGLTAGENDLEVVLPGEEDAVLDVGSFLRFVLEAP